MEARQTDSPVPQEVALLWVSCLKRVLRQSLSVFGVSYRLRDRIEMAKGREGFLNGKKEEEAEKKRHKIKAEVCRQYRHTHVMHHEAGGCCGSLGESARCGSPWR